MKIKLLEQLAIHEIQRETIPIGTVVDVLDDHATKLIDRGLAAAVKVPAKKAAPTANKKAQPVANKAAPRKRGR